MPQAKARFIVTGKFVAADGTAVKPGSLIDLEVNENGAPVNGLIASRVKPFEGEVIGEAQTSATVPDDVKANVQQYVEAANKEALEVVEAANKEALEVVEAAKAEAEQIKADAGKEAEKMINEATAAAEKIIADAKKK